MKFVNREKEMEEIKRCFELSKRKIFPIMLYGHRRVGKTRLMIEFLKEHNGFYFFVNESKSRGALINEYQEQLKERKIITEYETIKNFDALFNIIFERVKEPIIFDEFQNFLKISPEIYGILQKNIDLNEDKPLFIIFSGSVIGLIKKVFEKKNAPLYGRIKVKIELKPMKYRETRNMMKILGYKKEDDFVNFYSIFGGFPKYFALIEDYGLNGKDIEDVIKEFFFKENAILEDEVISTLRQEFGKGKARYFDILAAISKGKTKLSEISSDIGIKITSIGPFMRDLIEDFRYLKKEIRVTDGPRSKKVIYKLNNPLFEFWFKFIHPFSGYYEMKNFQFIFSYFKDNINAFTGRRFEEICKEFLMENSSIYFTKMGRWWGHYKNNNERKEIEIDIIALEENKKEIYFFECKWKELKENDANKIIKDLKEKAKYVEWFNEERNEMYGIFGKRIEGKENLRKEGILAYDLEDINK